MIIDVTNGDASGVAYWKAERFLVKWTTNASEIIFAYQSGADTVEVARYQTANGGVLIDITDFVRAYPERNLLLFGDGSTTVRGVIFSVAGLINPAGVLIPEHDGEETTLIAPPTCMYYAPAFLPAIFETRPRAGVTGLKIKQRNAGGVPIGFDTLPVPSVTLNSTAVSLDIEDGEGVQILSRTLRETNCACRYACVEWVSFTGAKRRHVFEITKATVETGDVVALANILNEWTEIKGRVDGFTLRLENLDRYDLWYYSDLITSGRVRVTIDGTNWYDVHVDENAYTLPESNAGKLSTLEIPVKFRKYDAVSL